MRSQRLRSRTAHSALRPRLRRFDRRCRHPDCGTGRTHSRRGARHCSGVCASARWRMLGPGTAHAVDGTWTGPWREWTTGTNWSSSPDCARCDTATFTNNGAPTSVTISNSTSINTIEFDAAAPAYSFTVQNGATFTSTISYRPFLASARPSASAAARRWRSGMAARSRSARWRVAATCSSARPIPTTLFISGSTSTTFSGVISGPGSSSSTTAHR